jgi:hypothetical protein
MIKRTVSILLVITLLFSCMFPVSAKTDACDCGFSPIIYVAALGSATLYVDAGTENERVIFRPAQEDTLKLVGKLALPAVQLAINKNYEAFGRSVSKAATEMFGPLAMDENGDSNPRITTKTTLPTDASHGPNRDYYFGYDFRVDPLVTAEKLHDYVQHVKTLTGHNKVKFRASSLGGMIVMAYLDKYGTDELDAIIFQCCPILGVGVAGDLFTKQLEFNNDALVRYGMQVLPEDATGSLLSILIQSLDALGVFSAVLGLGDTLVDNLLDQIYDELLIPIFGRMPGLWALVPDVSYEQAKTIFLGDNASQTLRDRLDYYHYNVQGKANEILNGALDDGVGIMILAGYNLQREPFVASYMNNSDAVDDTIYNAPGVTCALLGETLGEGYVQAVNDGHNHLSADGVIDASTCYLPENTWFVKDMLHSTPNAGHRELYTLFFLSDSDFNVHTDQRFPQFLQNDAANSKVVPLVDYVPDDSLRIEDILGFVLAFIKSFKLFRFS